MGRNRTIFTFLLLVGGLIIFTCGEVRDLKNGYITFSLTWRDNLETRSTKLVTKIFSPRRALPSGVVQLKVTVSGPGMSDLVQTFGDLAPEGGVVSVVGVPPGEDRTATVEGLDGGGNVLYRGIKTGISVAEGKVTDAGVIEMLPAASLPGAPTGVKVVSGDDYLSLSWDAVEVSAYYKVYYDTDSGAPYEGTGASEGDSPIKTTSTNATLSGLPTGTVYYLAVTAYNASGESDYSSEIICMTMPSPTGVSATGRVRRIELSWDMVDLATGYKIYYDSDASGSPYEGTEATEGASPISTTNTTFALNGLAQATKYYLTITATKDEGESGYSEEQEATTYDFIELYRIDGQYGGDRLGFSVSGAGDLDGDGYDDIIAGAPYAWADGKTGAGICYVYTGQYGTSLYQKNGNRLFENLGYSVSGAGDVDKDGFPDFIVGASGLETAQGAETGGAYVYSGKDGAQLQQKEGEYAYDRFGTSVSGAGDVNVDGYDDFIVGAPEVEVDGKGNAGRVYVYSGKDPTITLCQIDLPSDNAQFGSAVSGVGDINGDGYDDFVVGAPGYLSGAGTARVYSANLCSLYYQKNGTSSGDNFGTSVGGAGDVNKDGYPDFIIGSPGADPEGKIDAGSAYVYSGKDGLKIYGIYGEKAYDGFGYAVSGAGDVNKDGYDDFIIGAPQTDPDPGRIYLYSGFDGSSLFQKNGEAEGDNFGASVDGAGDVNDDGYPDLIVGAPKADSGPKADAGQVYVYTPAPPQ